MALTITKVKPRRNLKAMSQEEFRQAENERLRKYNTHNKARATRSAEHDLTFICVDGEGAGRDENHRYVLLGCGEIQYENTSGIDWEQAFAHFYAQFEANHPQTVYAGFFLSYDFTQIFKTLPENKAWQLLSTEGQERRKRRTSGGNPTPFPVRCVGKHGTWEFDLHADRRLRIRPKRCDCPDDGHVKGSKCGQDKVRWMYINDAGGFFQTSLLNVIDPAKWAEPIVTETEFKEIERGKSKRDSARLDDDMRYYNRLENEIFARVLTELNKGLVKAGVRLDKRQWYGPGQAAQQWLRHVGAPTGEDIRAVTKPKILDATRRAYYGGWFEIMAHGHIPGITWEFDINSAYPYIIAQLPCLLHGTWQTRQPRTPVDSLPPLPPGALRLVQATAWGSDPHVGTMLHRTIEQTILRPDATRGWFWQHELDAAIRAGVIDRAEYQTWHTYTPCDCPSPLRGMTGLYEGRLAIGKDTAQGKAYKLVYNSAYGKFAQSVGEPPYANPIYASLITAGCRTMILDAIATHPQGTSAVVMVATDGVYFTSAHPGLPVSSKLGDWEVKEKHNLTLFKPGVYWDDSTREDIREGKKPVFKTRGVNAESFAKVVGQLDEQFRQLDGHYPQSADEWPSAEFELGFSMVTAKQALQYHKWHLAGKITTDKKVKQDSNPSDKRDPGQFANGIMRSRPKSGRTSNGVQLSQPYDKTFGSAAMFESGMMDKDQYGITPDGLAVDGLYEALGTRE